MLQNRAKQLEVASTGTGAFRCARDFSRIPVNAPAAGTIQAKLTVNSAGDIYEQEADSVDDQVMGMDSPLAANVQRRTAAEKPIQRKTTGDCQATLWRQPNPDAGVRESQPLQTLPPKVEGGQKASTPAEPVCKSPSNIKLPCTPNGLADVDFMKTGAPGEAFGFTHTLSKEIPPPPEVRTEPAGKSKRVVVQKTNATPVPCESFFIKAGSVLRTIPLDPKKPEQRANAEKCGTSYLRKFRITSDGENKIKEMEMEHCNDFKHAFDISIGCYAAIVNDLAKKKTEFPSQEAAVDAVTKSAGRKPDTWVARYIELLTMTKKRDTKNWHTAVEPKGPPIGLDVDRRGRCQSQFATEINEESFPEVGKDKHPTSDVVK